MFTLRRPKSCLAGITQQEIEHAATQDDAGDFTASTALVQRVPFEHARCIGYLIIKRTRRWNDIGHADRFKPPNCPTTGKPAVL